ncbi:hypothetical protein [Paractinoplanes rishiriensis]|uniref:Alpha/beta hydrolase n=1 Tax=Paractinoplanes rishiriensis TaxID=1050105 RepID=A0A919MNW5_9ACTN|nr:hypothetical protein [Actinoplanes rishiriensis]GIE94461.1 hypothetical protein Ari01nite_19260 [Actinoplanes rishiriensis]
MPIIFVHGVATRRERGGGRPYDRRVAARTALIRRFLAPATGLDPEAVRILNPYWGDQAARFRWDGASLDTVAERFGGTAEAEALLAEDAPEEDPPPAARTLLGAARRSPESAVDLLWSAAASVESAGAADFDRLAVWAERAADWAAGTEPDDLTGLGDDLALFNLLAARAAGEPAGPERFGGGTGLPLLREGLNRVQSAGSRLASRTAAGLVRRRVQEESATFVGDVLTYLRQRERHGADGPIAAAVATDLEAARRACSADDPHVVVVAHSMGGNIVFDLLSNLRTDLSCDLLVTVGSQVGLFAELGLLPAVTEPPPGAVTPAHRSPRPKQVGRWINVFDTCDVLSFATEGIFDGTEDYVYSTGRGLIRSHSAYFLRPSFFRRLAHRLGEPR